MNFGANSEVFVQRRFSRLVDGHIALGVTFNHRDFDKVVANRTDREGGELTNAHSSLQKELDDSGNSSIGPSSIADRAVFHTSQDPGSFGVKFRVGHSGSHIIISVFVKYQETIESFDRIDLARDRFWGVVLGMQKREETVEVLGSDVLDTFSTGLFEVF